MQRFAQALVLVAAGALHAHDAVADDHWQGVWGFPPINPMPPEAPNAANTPAVADFNDVTVRQIVRITGDAHHVRVRFSNEFGASELKFDHAHIALAGTDGLTLPGSDHELTFDGHSFAAIPAGAPLLSDPVDWQLPALSRLAVSVHLPGTTVPPAHRVLEYVSAPGDHGADTRMDGAQAVRTGALVSGVEADARDARTVIVTLGDSITEGHGSTANEFRTWPDRLAERLQARAATRRFRVVNAGINSNRLLHNNPGMGALARFDRDVLGVPGVGLVVLLEGINDIGYSHTVPTQAVTAQEIIGAYRQLVARAHAHGIAIVAGTITPFEDAHYFTPEGETLRQAVNRWIRTGDEFDGVIDFDAVLRDAAHPARVNSGLTLPDHLHPNDAGYEAMAQSIDLKRLVAAARRYAGGH
jgi:lysophospholipase L1-like esterase